MKRFSLFAIFFILFAGAFRQAQAVEVGGSLIFNIDEDYDIAARPEIKARLALKTSQLYFFIEENWWDKQTVSQQGSITRALNDLSLEFEGKIYPVLTSVYGQEWKPGIDGDERITILFHSMREDAGGYFRSSDGYIKFQVPDSNEKEMVYLNVANILNPQLKAFLAHEFVHLIIFNQKDRLLGLSEEVWLNEARAEYAPTILGYDMNYEGSNLQRRVSAFLANPSDSVTEWRNRRDDYAVANLFFQYLADHYSVEVLAKSLKSNLVGIPSLNQALSELGFKEKFPEIFTDWTIAVLLNDCSLNKKYCYLSGNLKDFRISPSLNLLPLAGKSSLAVTDVTKNWAGNWQKFIGGNGDVRFKFDGLDGLNFKLSYLIQLRDGSYSVNFVNLDLGQKGEIIVPDFGQENVSLIIIPSLQTKMSGFDGVEPNYSFAFEISSEKPGSGEDQKLIKELLAQIDFLQKEIARLQSEIAKILGGSPVSCQILNNLQLGDTGDDVRCLQEFLKSQGPGIYPEGLITGYFGSLTRAAVIRFQEKYASEILAPFGLFSGTGFVGSATRAKINTF